MKWPAETIGAVVHVNPKFDTVDRPDPDEMVSFVPMASVSEKTLRIENEAERPYAEVAKGYTPFKRGDLLIAKITPCFENGKMALADNLSHDLGFGTTEFHVLRPSEKVSGSYLFHLLREPYVRRAGAMKMRGAAGQRRVPADFFSSFEIPLPPLDEQKRIAEILDAADALRVKRRQSFAQLEFLLQSVFFDMFGDPATNPRGWAECIFGDILEISSSKRVLQKQWQRSGVPFYRAREIVRLSKDGYVDNDLFISEEHFKELRSKHGIPEAGDIMVSAVGTLGASYVVQPGDRFYFKDASVLKFTPGKSVESVFVKFALGTEHVMRQVKGGSGSTVGTYTISRAKSTRFYLPPLDLQRRFVSVVESVERQKAQLLEHISGLETLFASLQSRAFRGEL